MGELGGALPFNGFQCQKACHSNRFSVRRLVTQTVSVTKSLTLGFSRMSGALSLKPFQCQKACHSNRFSVRRLVTQIVSQWVYGVACLWVLGGAVGAWRGLWVLVLVLPLSNYL